MNSIYDEIHALDQTIKFLNEEAGHSHMGYYHTKQGWAGQQLIAARDRLKEIADMPEPKDTGWIKLSERKPTEADATMSNNALRVLFLFRENGGFIHLGPFDRPDRNDTHWCAIPKFIEEKDPDEEAKKRACAKHNWRVDDENSFGIGWDAALQYARQQD